MNANKEFLNHNPLPPHHPLHLVPSLNLNHHAHGAHPSLPSRKIRFLLLPAALPYPCPSPVQRIEAMRDVWAGLVDKNAPLLQMQEVCP